MIWNFGNVFTFGNFVILSLFWKLLATITMSPCHHVIMSSFHHAILSVWQLVNLHQSVSIIINWHQSASKNINQHQPASISFDEQQLASISSNQQQSVSIRINYLQHQLKSISINNHCWASTISTNKHQYQRDLSIIVNQHQLPLASINAYIENVRIALSMKNKLCILTKCSVTWHSFLRCEFFMCSD